MSFQEYVSEMQRISKQDGIEKGARKKEKEIIKKLLESGISEEQIKTALGSHS